MTGFESIVEQAATEWLERLGYAYVPGWELTPDGSSSGRTGYSAVILEGRLRAALARINPALPSDALDEEAVRAKMRSKVKRLLRKRGYPPDKQEAAVVTVIERGEQVCRDWAA